jgi:recombinational DNA repair protein (RecF pathway)
MSEVPKYKSHTKEYVNGYNATKIICELCGQTVRRSYLRPHQRRKICIKNRNPEAQNQVKKPVLKVKDKVDQEPKKDSENNEETKGSPDIKKVEIKENHEPQKDNVQKLLSLLIYL